MSLFNFEHNNEASWVIFGVPFGGGSLDGEHLERGPDAMRACTQSFVQGRRFDDLFDCKNRPTDIGNIHFDNRNSVIDYFQLIGDQVLKLLKNRKRCFAIGGDHSISFPIIKSYSSHFEHLNVLHIDAHYDTSNEKNMALTPNHANFVDYLIEHRSINNWYVLGPRIGNIHPLHRQILIKDLDIIPKDIPLYLTIDIDGFDPSISPAVNHPVPFGLDNSDILDFLRWVKSFNGNIVGVDWVEYDPSLDSSNYMTGRLLAYLMGKILAILESQHSLC